jgi:NifU-like protein involved in Fe-S cluster formation
MDELIINHYRRLVRNGFKYAGSFENPSIFLTDKTGERIRVCSNIGSYLNLYINISGNNITAIKYLCICNPSTHVAIEIICALVDGKTLEAAGSVTPDSFFKMLGGESGELIPQINSLIQLLKIGLERYQKTT